VWRNDIIVAQSANRVETLVVGEEEYDIGPSFLRTSPRGLLCKTATEACTSVPGDCQKRSSKTYGF
jgi:hypothetical protein